MAAVSTAGTIAGQKYYNGEWEPAEGYRNEFAYAGTNYDHWYPYILKFTVPEFSGLPLELEFTLNVGQGIGEAPTLRWALCSSDENQDSYLDTNAAVVDPSQLAVGTVTMADIASNHYQTLTVNASGIKPGGTYYLYLWGYAEPSAPQYIKVYLAEDHSVVLHSVSGSVVVIAGGVKRAATAVVKWGGKLCCCTAGVIQNGEFTAG